MKIATFVFGFALLISLAWVSELNDRVEYWKNQSDGWMKQYNDKATEALRCSADSHDDVKFWQDEAAFYKALSDKNYKLALQEQDLAERMVNVANACQAQLRPSDQCIQPDAFKTNVQMYAQWVQP